MALTLARPTQLQRPTISNRQAQSQSRPLIYRASGLVERAPPPPGKSYAQEFSEEKINELLSLGFTKTTTGEGFTLIAPPKVYQKYWDRDFRSYMNDPTNPSYSTYFSTYIPEEYTFDKSGLLVKSIMRESYLEERSSSGGWSIYGTKVRTTNQYDWTAGQLETTTDTSRPQTFMHIAQLAALQKSSESSGLPIGSQVAYEYDIQIGPTKYPVKVLKEPTYRNTRQWFSDNNKKAVFTIFQDLQIDDLFKKKKEEGDMEGFIEVSPKLYNKFILENFGAFPTRKNKQGISEVIQLAKEGENRKYYLQATTKAEAMAYASQQISISMSKKQDKLGNAMTSLKSLSSGLIKSAIPGYSLKNQADQDIKNFREFALGPIKNIAIPTIKGAGKSLYFFTDVTLVRLGGSKIRDLIPTTSWKEVDRRKLNKGLGSWIGENSPMADNDVKTFATAAGLGFAAWAAPVVIPAIETFAIVSGANEVASGAIEQDYGKIGTGAFLIAAGRPIKKISRPFKEIIFERISTEEIFADVAGKKVTANSMKESLTLFKRGKTHLEGQLKSQKTEVISISDRPLKEYRKGYVRIGFGEKGKAGIEDRGLWAGSKGRGNIMFSGIPGTATYEGYSLNPFTNLGLKPTATKIYIDSVARQPRNLIERPGFTDLVRQNFINKKIKGTGFGIITKRSEIGQGMLKRQNFKVLEDITLRTVKYTKGQIVKEAGSSEIELIINPGEVLKRKMRPTDLLIQRIFGYRYYTRYGAKKIPFTDFEIPLTGEYVRIKEYNLMKWRSAKGFAGKNDIWTEKLGKGSIKQEAESGMRSISVRKQKISFPVSQPKSLRSSGKSTSMSKILSQIQSASKQRSSRSGSSKSMSQVGRSSISRSRRSLASTSISSRSGSSRSRNSISKALRSISVSKSTSKSASKSSSQRSQKVLKKQIAPWEKPRKIKEFLFLGYREFKVNLKAVFGKKAGGLR